MKKQSKTSRIQQNQLGTKWGKVKHSKIYFYCIQCSNDFWKEFFLPAVFKEKKLDDKLTWLPYLELIIFTFHEIITNEYILH